jgi:hypothetical protein
VTARLQGAGGYEPTDGRGSPCQEHMVERASGTGRRHNVWNKLSRAIKEFIAESISVSNAARERSNKKSFTRERRCIKPLQ